MNSNKKIQECSQWELHTDRKEIVVGACPLGNPSGVACQEAMETGACSQECIGGRKGLAQ